ncbi:unnamed protein product [Closterium sp. NIES-54]
MNDRRCAHRACLAASARASRGQRYAPSGMLVAGRVARISRPALCAQRNARRWARSAQLAASAMRQAMRIPLGALRLSRGQQCAQRIAHRWAHCASLAASNALSGLLTAGRIAPLSRPAMRSADCSPLGALRLSLQRYSPCGISAAWRIAVLSRPALCAQRKTRPAYRPALSLRALSHTTYSPTSSRLDDRVRLGWKPTAKRSGQVVAAPCCPTTLPRAPSSSLHAACCSPCPHTLLLTSSSPTRYHLQLGALSQPGSGRLCAAAVLPWGGVQHCPHSSAYLTS